MTGRSVLFVSALVALLVLMALVGLPAIERDSGFHATLSPRDPNLLLGAAAGLLIAVGAIVAAARREAGALLVPVALGVVAAAAGVAIGAPTFDANADDLFPPGTQILVVATGPRDNAPFSPHDGNTFLGLAVGLILAAGLAAVLRRRASLRRAG